MKWLQMGKSLKSFEVVICCPTDWDFDDIIGVLSTLGELLIDFWENPLIRTIEDEYKECIDQALVGA